MKGKSLADKEFNSKLISLTMPITFQSLMLALVATADALMLGRLEQNAMSAVSLATQIQFVQNMILYAAISALNILGAQYWGKRDEESLNKVFGIGLKLCVSASVLFFIGCVFFSGQMMRIFTNEQSLIEMGASYLKIAGWSYLLTGISQCYLALMKITENAAAAARISSTTVVINIVLNAVFIFGFLKMPAMGVRGAAIATLISRVIELIWCVISSARKKFFNPRLGALFVSSGQLFKDYYKNAIPLVGAQLFWGVGFTSYSAFMGHLGTNAAAANSVAAVVRDLVCCLGNGLSGAAGIMVGNELGAGKLEKGKLYGNRLMKLSFFAGVLSSVVMLLLTPLLMKFVKLEEGAKEYLLGMMIIMAVYMIGRTVNTIVINGIFAAGGDTLFDMYSLAVVMWCFAVPLAAAGTFWLHWPVLVIYGCTCLDEVGKIPWVIYHFKKYKWVKDLTRG